jgi:hypothetical protein
VHGTSSHLKLFQSPGKQTRVEGTLVPGAYNAVMRPTRSASGAVAPGDEGGEPKVDVENGHVIPPLYEIGNQSSGQRRTADFAMEAQNDRPVQSPRGCMPAGQGKAAYHEQKEIELCEVSSSFSELTLLLHIFVLPLRLIVCRSLMHVSCVTLHCWTFMW